ncbi:MAG TPA: esterase, partial [Chloroflexota bacterium]|nr:esterase [Chloroflexota bacterium]
MEREYQHWHSPVLNREMELLVFGRGGAAVLVFPTSMGRFYQYEDFGMVEALRHHIEQGWIQLFCVDSVDME